MGAQALLEVRRRFLAGGGRPSMLMLVRSAAALATIQREPKRVAKKNDTKLAHRDDIFSQLATILRSDW